MANKTATMQTNKGMITLELFTDDAPITAGNFVDLVEKGFYNGLTFHRYEPGFVIQGGDPVGNGTGGYIPEGSRQERRIKLEVKPHLKHNKPGILAMARSNEPDSASSQFYFTLGDASFLDMKYAVFGQAVAGLDVVQSLRKGDTIESVTIDG
jgi:cyclophilin family peptidyl-prolyl cis-trans isomerase